MGNARIAGAEPPAERGGRPRARAMVRAAVLAAAVVLCGSEPEAGSEGPVRVSCFVSILPQAYFVERVGGEHVDVHVMVGPGQSPATYEPTPKQLTRLAESRVYFSIGVPFESSLLPRIRRSFDDVEIVDTRDGIALRPADGHEVGSEKALGASPGERPEALDPHVWLSPRLAKTIARNIRDELARIDPVHSDDYSENCDALSADLDRLDGEIAGQLAPFRGSRFYVFHPAYGYFAEAYGLIQVAVEFEGGTPGPRHLAEVIEQAETSGVNTVFVQPQFSRKAAETISEAIGAQVVPLDPLARDYRNNLRDIARKISLALGGRAGEPAPAVRGE